MRLLGRSAAQPFLIARVHLRNLFSKKESYQLASPCPPLSQHSHTVRHRITVRTRLKENVSFLP